MSACLQQQKSIAVVRKTLSIVIVHLKVNNCNNVMLIVMVAIVHTNVVFPKNVDNCNKAYKG